MSHQRQAIRAAVETAIGTTTVAGTNVFINRPNPLSQRPNPRSSESMLPAILIYTKDESSAVYNEAPRMYKRTVELVVELAMAMTDSIDDDLDTFADVVENRILQDDSLGGTAAETRLVSSTMTIVDTGEMPIGAVVMTFDVDYFQHFPGEDYEPEGTGDFRTMNTTTDVQD